MLNVFQMQNRQTEPEGESDRFCRALTSTNCNQLELDNTPQRKNICDNLPGKERATAASAYSLVLKSAFSFHDQVGSCHLLCTKYRNIVQFSRANN